MSQVRVFSDLHLEFGLEPIKKCVNMCAANRTKYTILAGDITNFEKREFILTKLVSELKPHTDHIIYVLGNHEYYKQGKKSVTEIKIEYKILCEKLEITLLEDTSFETDDFIFYGATMWTNMNTVAFKQMNDRYSFKSHDELISLHENSVSHLTDFMNNYNSTKPLVVITHHLPSFTLIDKIYECYSDINSGFASRLDYLIAPPIKYWVYGHTHKPNTTVINGIKLFCNSHGYPGHECANFKDCVF